MQHKKSVFKSRTVISASLGLAAAILIFAQKAAEENVTFTDVSALTTALLSSIGAIFFRVDAHDELYTPRGLPGPDPD